MVEKNTVARVDVISLAIVDSNPISIQFSRCVRRFQIKRRCFALRDFLHLAEQFRG